MLQQGKTLALDVPQELLEQWQGMVDMMAELAGVPAGLIMRVEGEDIEVFVSSETENSPYITGKREHWEDSGLYCETVVKTQQPLLIPNALTDPDWKDNPDVKLNMVSYLGFPISFPDRTPFGTICVLDDRPNAHNKTIVELLKNLSEVIENHLERIYANAVLGDTNKRLVDYLDELKAFRGMVVICSTCKKIKDDDGRWRPVERYLVRHPSADFSHSYCPSCFDKFLEDAGVSGPPDISGNP